MALAAKRRIALDRRVCVVDQGLIEVRPERSAVIGPLLGLILGVGLFVAVALFAENLSLVVLTAMLVPGIIIAPLSAMGLIYSLVGASVVIDAKKQSVRFQQGMLGLGLGTVELVPFWKVDRIELEDLVLGEVTPKAPRPPLDFRGWDIVLVKTSGKRLSLGTVVAANVPELLDEGFGRAMEAAQAISGLVEKPLAVTAAVEEVEEETEAMAALPQDQRLEPRLEETS